MTSHRADRRHFLSRTARLAAAGTTLPWLGQRGALATETVPALPPSEPKADPAPRALAFHHTHTHEQISLVYAADGTYLPQALSLLNRFMRDHYSGRVGSMDPQLFDLLHRLRLALDSASLPPFEVISGYRCPETNSLLRQSRGGGVARRSLHMDGRAIDVRLPGVPLAELRDAALALQGGGVGYYPNEQFVHIDTGRVRRWG